MTSQRKKFAKLLNEISQIERQQIFEHQTDKYSPIHYPEDCSTMFAGYVGKAYEELGLVVFGVNPGGGKDTYQRHPQDDKMFAALRKFKSANSEHCLQEFEAVNNTFMPIVKTWNLWRILEPTLQAFNKNLDEICYFNVVPYRTREDKKPPVNAQKNSWSLTVSPVLSLSKPKVIACLGKKAGKIVSRFNETDIETYIIPRTNGDTYVRPEAKEVLKDIAHQYAT